MWIKTGFSSLTNALIPSITGVIDESDILGNSNILSSGSFFTKEQLDNGENVIILEKTLADLNDFSIGDTITIEKVEMKRGKRNSDVTENSSEGIKVTYTIVGIYETENKSDLSDNNFGMSINMEENKMYVPHMSVLKMQEIGLTDDELGNLKENGYVVESVTFIINDPENSDAFTQEVKNMKNIN